MQLNDIVNLIFGNLPEEFEFIKIYGYIFILYILISLFKFFYDIAKGFFK